MGNPARSHTEASKAPQTQSNKGVDQVVMQLCHADGKQIS